jgi:hypothetical protein
LQGGRLNRHLKEEIMEGHDVNEIRPNGLRGCPFCGNGTAELAPLYDHFGKTDYMAECIVCGCRTQRGTKEESISKWNRRYDSND